MAGFECPYIRELGPVWMSFEMSNSKEIGKNCAMWVLNVQSKKLGPNMAVLSSSNSKWKGFQRLVVRE